jgi:hypothetical protein
LHSLVGNVSKKFENDEIIEQILKLRVKAAAALEVYETTHARIDFYRKYLSLSKTYKVRLAGRFFVVQGGRSTEAARSDSRPQKPSVLEQPDSSCQTVAFPNGH